MGAGRHLHVWFWSGSRSLKWVLWNGALVCVFTLGIVRESWSQAAVAGFASIFSLLVPMEIARRALLNQLQNQDITLLFDDNGVTFRTGSLRQDTVPWARVTLGKGDANVLAFLVEDAEIVVFDQWVDAAAFESAMAWVQHHAARPANK